MGEPVHAQMMMSDNELAHDFAHRLRTVIAQRVTTDDTGGDIRALTISALASLISDRPEPRISRSHLYRLARGERVPHYMDIMILAVVLEVSPHALVIPTLPD